MRRLVSALLPAALLVPTAAAQTDRYGDDAPPRPVIRAWMGVHAAFATDFGAVGFSGDYRFTIERLGGPSASVVLGGLALDRDANGNGGGSIGYGALLGGRSFEIGDGAFANASIGVGYGQGFNNDVCAVNFQSYDHYESSCNDARGIVVPARLEVHVTNSSGGASFGASVSGALVSPIGSMVGLGLHVNLGRNLRGDRHRGDRYRDDRRRDDDRYGDDERSRDDR